MAFRRTISKIIIAAGLLIAASSYAADHTELLRKLVAVGEKPTEAEAIELVEKSYGAVRDTSGFSSLDQALKDIFGKLSKAQKKHIAGLPVENELRFVDSPVINAFVVSAKPPNAKLQAKNIVFVTSGFLDFLIEDATEKGLQEGLIRIAGGLAHELGHPIDTLDAEGIERLRGQLWTSQAVEIRADVEGVRIAREAGFPEDSLYKAMAKLLDGNSQSNVASAALSTHPQRNVRLSIQRLFMTANRYKTGALPSTPIKVTKKLQTELQQHRKSLLEQWKFVEPTSLDEASRRIISLANSDSPSLYRNIEFNRLLVRFDEMLIEKGSRLSKKDKAAADAFVQDYVNRRESYPEILNRSQLGDTYNASNLSEHFRSGRSHEELVGQIEYFKSPDFRLKAKELLVPNGASWSKLRDNIVASRLFLPPENLFSDFADPIAKAIAATVSDDMIDFSSNFQLGAPAKQGLPRTLPLEYDIRFAELLHNRVRPLVGPDAWTGMLITRPTSGGGTPWLPSVGYARDPQHGLGVLRNRQMLLLDPKQKNLAELYRNIAGRIWDERGYYAAAELLMSHQNMDWPVIFELLKLDPKVGYSQIRSAVKEFCKTPAYAKMLGVAQTPPKGVSFRADAIQKPERVAWASPGLEKYIRGDLNEGIQNSPELRKFTTESAYSAYVRNFSDPIKDQFLNEFAKRIASSHTKPPIASLRTWIQDVAATVEPMRMRGWNSEQVIIERIPEIITAIESAKWPKSEKSALLRALFLNPVRTTVEPTDTMNPVTKAFQELWKAEGTDHRKLVLDTLVKHGVARERLEILEAVKKAGESRLLSGNYNRIDHFGLVSQLRQSLISELQLELGRLHDPKARLLKYNEWAKSVFTTNLRPPSGLDVSNPNTIAMRSLKDDFCSLLLKEKFAADQQIELFRVVTRTGPSKGTDLLLEDVLSRSTTNRSLLEKLKLFLLEQNISKPSLQVRVAEAVLQELREESKARNSTIARKEFMSELNSLVPEASTEKDKLLERLAYELEVPKTELQELIEDYKTTNWRKVEPLKANVASVLGEQIESMPEHLREELIAHISKHSDQPLPRTFLDGFEQEVFRRIVANPRNGVNPYTDARMKAKAITRKLQYEVEMALADAKATEKIPALEMLLASGKMPGQELDLVQARRLSRNVLGYAANSIEEKLLLSFLETVPSHEGSTTLAYLLSQAGRERGSVAALFEVFQTVGIKFGQLASTWKLLGEEIAEETKSLKSSAEPLTKMEIEQILEKELSAAEYRKIKGVKKVLGSASLKNAALLELRDGTQVVALIQRPYASNQVYTNLDLSKKFLATVRRNGVEIPGGMMQSILGALEEQLADELRMSKEAEHIVNAQVAYQNYNTTLAKDLKGWKFEMPGVSEKFAIRDHLLFVDLAPGTTLDRLSVETKRAVGKPIVKSALNSLFERGVFNADSHSGNFLIHEESRTIAPIDVGQTEQFSKRTMWAADDRYNLAQFIRALDSGDEKRIIQYALQMQKPGSPTPSGPELRNAVHTVLKQQYVNEADRIVDVVNALAENGLVLDRKFSFGGLKGLVVLMGEEYVTPAEFRALLGDEVKKVLLNKAPVTIKDAIAGPPRTTRPNGSAAGCLLRALGKFLR